MMLSQLRTFLTIPMDKPELAQAQFAAFSKQVPLLYLMLVANTAALSISHFDVAPLSLTLGIPGILYAISIFRLIGWYAGRGKMVTAEQAVRRLRGTIRFAFLLGAGFTGWSFSLYGYGDALNNAHIAFYMSITIVGCIFCLMHLRAAAVLLVFIVLGPFTVFFGSTGVFVFQAIAVNVVLVAAALLYILNIYYNDFAQLIASRKELQARQADTQRLSDENLRLANIDSLTGLYNRRWFIGALADDLAAAQAGGSRLAVGMIDLDGFKPVNDAYGHAAGDRVLVEVARRLMREAGDAIRIARLGGDEFGFIIRDAGNEAAVQAQAAALIAILLRPYELRDLSVRVGASAGAVLYPDGAQTAEDLFEYADYALFHAKQTGRGQAVIFTAALATEIAYRSVVEQELKRSSIVNELSVVFQPLWSVSEARTYGVEALARWNSPVLGAVRPDIFITVAERSGQIGRLTEILLDKALAGARRMPADITLCFNLSAKDVECTETFERLLDKVSDSGFDPGRLVFELTETSILTNSEEADKNLARVRKRGIGVAIDDFGTGQSSLAQVHRLPITKIKIASAFVADIGTSHASRTIVRSILDLARNLDCTCIVEGVETAAQAAALRLLGCNLMQGYHFGRPMMVEELIIRLDGEAAARGRQTHRTAAT
jgi:diguanylate cyclase (GGDEF)-like protein